MPGLEGAFIGGGGLRIAYRSWAPRSPRAPRAAVVVVHTVYDHSARYDEFAGHLVRRGMQVWAHDQRGHGTSDGERGLIDSFDDAVADLGQVVQLASADHEAPVFVVGHSVGALVALGFALANQGKLAGLVTTGVIANSSPAPLPIRMIGDRLHLDRLAAAVTPRLPFLSLDLDHITSDPVELEHHRRDPLVHHGRLPMRTVSEIAAAIRGSVGRHLDELHLPLLALHGAEDSIIGPRASVALHGAVSSTDRTLQILDHLRHDLFHERQPARGRVFEHIAGWIEGRSG